MKSNKSPMVKYAFYIFGILIGGINAALTAVFAYTYLPAAFGNPDGIMAQFAAAFYGLLIMDIAYLAWFYVYLRLAESKEQRGLSVTMAVLSLGGSIMATITQLATNSFGLVDLSAYTENVGLISMVVMIIVTALHIICFAAYTLTDPEESVKTMMTNTNANLLETALAEAKKRVEGDKNILVDAIAARMRGDMLNQIGFTSDLKQIGTGQEPVIIPGEATPATPPQQPATKTPVKTPIMKRPRPGGFKAVPGRAFPWPKSSQPQPDQAYDKANGKVATPAKKWGLWRNGHVIDESDNLVDLLRNPGYMSGSYLINQQRQIVDEEGKVRPFQDGMSHEEQDDPYRSFM